LHCFSLVELQGMYRFLHSLSIKNGPSSRTYHLLLAHFLQQQCPSVLDAAEAGGFSVAALAKGNFSFAPRTGIVVNLALMMELKRLEASEQLCGTTFADAVLRSQPAYLVQALLPLLEPASPQSAALRPKLVAQGMLVELIFCIKEGVHIVVCMGVCGSCFGTKSFCSCLCMCSCRFFVVL
jgi:hypothetical protein